MDATHPAQPTARPAHRCRRAARMLLAVAGLVTVVAASACDTAQQVPWATYNSGLQVRIDAAVVRGDCAALRATLNAAQASSEAHEKATGFPNDALVSYIQSAQARAGCPAGSS